MKNTRLPKKKQVAESLKKLIDAINVKDNADKVPDDWFTCRQCAEALEMSVCNASRKLQASVNDGSVITKKFKVLTNGIVRPIPHYKINI